MKSNSDSIDPFCCSEWKSRRRPPVYLPPNQLQIVCQESVSHEYSSNRGKFIRARCSNMHEPTIHRQIHRYSCITRPQSQLQSKAKNVYRESVSQKCTSTPEPTVDRLEHASETVGQVTRCILIQSLSTHHQPNCYINSHVH